MVDNSNMPHPKRLGSLKKKKPGTEPKTFEKGPKLGFKYLPTSKTSHCVHGIPLEWTRDWNDWPRINIQMSTSLTLVRLAGILGLVWYLGSGVAFIPYHFGGGGGVVP